MHAVILPDDEEGARRTMTFPHTSVPLEFPLQLEHHAPQESENKWKVQIIISIGY